MTCHEMQSSAALFLTPRASCFPIPFGLLSLYKLLVRGSWMVAHTAPVPNHRSLRHIIGVPNHVRAWSRTAYLVVGGHTRGLSVGHKNSARARGPVRADMFASRPACFHVYHGRLPWIFHGSCDPATSGRITTTATPRTRPKMVRRIRSYSFATDSPLVYSKISLARPTPGVHMVGHADDTWGGPGPPSRS